MHTYMNNLSDVQCSCAFEIYNKLAIYSYVATHNIINYNIWNREYASIKVNNMTQMKITACFVTVFLLFLCIIINGQNCQKI